MIILDVLITAYKDISLRHIIQMFDNADII